MLEIVLILMVLYVIPAILNVAHYLFSYNHKRGIYKGTKFHTSSFIFWVFIPAFNTIYSYGSWLYEYPIKRR